MYDLDFLRLLGPQALDTCTGMVDPRYIDQTAYYVTKRNLLLTTKQTAMPKHLPDRVYSRIRYPATESLKQCQERAYTYWKQVIAPRVLAGERVLIVAHANTIRALVKVIDNITDDSIPHLKIPNGVPLVYTLDRQLRPTDMTDDIGFQAKYLVSARNHSKSMTYERSVKRKLRSLFEYLDHDGDGRITQQCLLHGLSRLGNLNLRLDEVVDDPLDQERQAQLYSDICEYEVEEIIRCVPDADEEGGITLKAFLDSEETLLPRLSKLRLLQ